MRKNPERQRRQDLIQATLNRRRHLCEAEYILGKMQPGTNIVPDKVSLAKAIWDSGGEAEEVVKALTHRY